VVRALAGYNPNHKRLLRREIDAINVALPADPLRGDLAWSSVAGADRVLRSAGLARGGGPSISGGPPHPGAVCLLALGGSLVSYILFGATLKLKAERLAGNSGPWRQLHALPWWAGQALFAWLTWDQQACSPWAYSLAGLGIAWWVNASRAWKGPGEWGLKSCRVVRIERASWISAGLIDLFQLAMWLC